MREQSRILLFATAFGVGLCSRVAFVLACHFGPEELLFQVAFGGLIDIIKTRGGAAW